VAGDGGDRDRGRDADEDQQRRHQKTAANPEHSGHKSDRRAHRQDEEDIDRKIGDREIELHARLLLLLRREAGRGRSGQGFLIEYSPAGKSAMHARKRRAPIGCRVPA
jgi:hypothetical protein